MRKLGPLLLAAACSSARPAVVTPEDRRLHDDAVVVDMHSSITEAMFYESYDLLAPHSDRAEDLPRMKQGGLDAEVFNVFVHPDSVDLTQFFSTAMKQIDLLQKTARNSGGRIAFARNAGEVQENAGKGVISMLIGVGGGHMLLPGTDDEQLAHLKAFADRGVRYMTLSWSSSSPIGGSTAQEQQEGLTDFGRKAIPEMERLGIVPDLSHGSERLFWDVLRLAKKPILLSSSGARALSDHPRNASDRMLEAIARNGGAVCVDFSRTYLDTKFRRATQSLLQKTKAMRNSEKVELYRKEELPDVPLSELIDHIEHIAKVAGYDHVCLGSDFDGAPMMPNGLEDVSKLPAITALLRQRGWSDANIRKVLGENALRVLQAAEAQ
ncbi:MAG: dipeptidase [Myxococcales bacterium]|nr:dipeptidase [Myxococcales bacterium]